MDFDSLFNQHQEVLLKDFFTFLSFKTISADPKWLFELQRASHWLEAYLKKSGLEVEKWEREGYPPILFAKTAHDPKKPTLLLYCHYDVQPEDPLDLWLSPPFEPEIRENMVYARGASDNKGQCFYTIWALKLLLQEKVSLPYNIKFIIEGQEESGSTFLSLILEEKKEELKADELLIIDSNIESLQRPSITLGARGIVTMTMTLTGSFYDLHSGAYGGIVYNPNRALVELLAMTHDKEGRVAIKGFYDDVKELSEEELSSLSLHFDMEVFKTTFGALPTGVEEGLSPYASAWLRPTLEINGVKGGYGGIGFKTVIPAQALAKISCRLVPNQDPEKIGKLVKEFFLSHLPPGIQAEVEIHTGMGRGFRTNPHSPFAKSLASAYEEVFHTPCSATLLGGSIPIVAKLKEVAGCDALLCGTSIAEDRIHSPNEHFSIEQLRLGYKLISTLLYNHGNL